MKARFKVSGKQELGFWLRAFQMEFVIEQAQAEVIAGKRLESAVCPIISEYQCGRWYWQLFLMPKVDALGLVDGAGYLWLSDTGPEREEQIKEVVKLAKGVVPWDVVSKRTVIGTPKET
jgi:hypothetical protein